jgi:hypothetical protein
MYLFYLYHPDLKSPQRLKYDPVGWNELGKRLKRDTTTHGVFFEYNPKLRFVKDGRYFLQYFYEKYGVEANVTFYRYKKNRKTRMYDLDYTGRVNFTSYSIDPIYAECNIEQTGFTQKFKNRQDIKVDLQSSTSQEGVPLTTINPREVALPSKVILKRMLRNKQYKYEGGGTQVLQLFVDDPQTWYILLSLDPSTLSLDEIKTRQEYGLQATQDNPLDSKKYTHMVEYGGVHRFSFDQHVRLIKEFPFSGTFELHLVHGRAGNYTSHLVGSSDSFVSDLFQFANNYTVNLSEKDEIYIFYKLQVTASPSNNQLIFSEDHIDPFSTIPTNFTSILSIEADTVYPDSTANLMLMHEAFARTVESITDSKDVFVSNYYGRTESQPRTYAQDGEGSLRGITNGKIIRGFPTSTNHIYTSLKELIELAGALDGVGLGIEKVGNKEYVVVEKLNYFYSAKRAVQLPYVKDIKKTVLSDYYYNELEGGYDEWSNEEVGNLDEFNAGRQYTLPVSQVKNKLSLKSPYIASSYSIEITRRDSYTISSTKDNDLDNKNFIIQLRKNEGSIAVDRNEDFQSIGGVLNPASLYNVKLSPMRNIIRNGLRIRGGLYKRDEQQIKLSFGEGNTNLQSRLTTETATVNEKTINVSALGKALWIPEAYEFKYPLTPTEQAAIETEKYGYIEFSADAKTWKKGYLLDMQLGSDTELTTFKLLRANL